MCQSVSSMTPFFFSMWLFRQGSHVISDQMGHILFVKCIDLIGYDVDLNVWQ